MKKKLILLPTLLTSCFLGACSYRTEYISLQDMLSIDNRNSVGFYLDSEHNNDFENVVFDILKANISDAKMIGRSEGYEDSYKVRSIDYHFAIENDFKKMNSFFIDVYETGYVQTDVSGAGWLVYPESQRTLYTISEEATEKIFQEVEARVKEVNETLEAEKETAKNEHTIEKFFTTYSGLNDRSVIITKEGYSQKEHRPYYTDHVVKDADGDILEDLVNLEFEIKEDETFHINNDNSLYISAGNEWNMRISRYNSKGIMRFPYKSKYYGDISGECHFTVNTEKLLKLFEKLESKIKDQLPEQED